MNLTNRKIIKFKMLSQYFEFKPGIPVKIIEDYLYPFNCHRSYFSGTSSTVHTGICKLCNFKGITHTNYIFQNNTWLEVCIYCHSSPYMKSLIEYWFPITIYKNKQIYMLIRNQKIKGRIKYLIRRNNSYYYCIHYVINFKKYLFYIKYGS